MGPIDCDVDASPAAKARPEPILQPRTTTGKARATRSKSSQVSWRPGRQSHYIADTVLSWRTALEATSLGQLPLAYTRKKH
ncbi:hypothetical protein HYE68_006727 [Fusarium pseudograminearum]|nr:hypothetical protein HYE68_006727 [Fusarium pseudograminearum]